MQSLSKPIITSCFLLFFIQVSKAQNPQKALGLEIESDPIAFILNGYSLHLAYTFSEVRASIGVFGIEVPGMFLDNKAFSVYSSGYDVKLDYLFGSQKGLFLGSQLTYGKDNIGLKESQESQNLWGYSIGLRSGYRFMLGKKENNFKGLYIVPWVALIHSVKAQEIQFGPETYSQPSWTVFPTVHVGWRF